MDSYTPEFAGPPPETRGPQGGIWKKRLAPLMDRPGEWARFPSTSPGLGSDIRAGRYAIPPGRWEFAGRTVDGQRWMYARYLGPEVES